MKNKFELEYSLNTSAGVLFSRLSTASGLSEWFADNVNVDGNIFTFFWDGSEEKAEMQSMKESKYIRFQWLEEDDPKSYFEFRIESDDLTGDSFLFITDFADDDEKDDAVDLWNSQIAELKHVLGL
ncbi:MAG: SRPBCC domain-containing protein [Bacteroidales bacterium]|nr:SRPBCC domain-containing protein [Bacteroidales bacterium]MCB9014046.1 SRPBCC domain-containing protein [Bacteroidales bacterium]